MAKFDADRLRMRLERLNREQLEKLERFTEELLREAERKRLPPKRADDAGPSRRAATATTRRRAGGKA